MNEVYSIPDQPTETKNVLQNLVTITLRILKKNATFKQIKQVYNFIIVVLQTCHGLVVFKRTRKRRRDGISTSRQRNVFNRGMEENK